MTHLGLDSIGPFAGSFLAGAAFSTAMIFFITRWIKDDKHAENGPILNKADLPEIKGGSKGSKSLPVEPPILKGKDIFDNSVEAICRLEGVSIAFVGRLKENDPGSVETLAICQEGAKAERFEYQLAGSPCFRVLREGACAITSGVPDKFPEDLILQELGIESYVGAPLFSTKGKLLGVLVALGTKPLDDASVVQRTMEELSGKLALELERQMALSGRLTSERNLKSFFDQVDVGVGFTGTDFALTYVNDALARMFGYAKHELIGKKVLDLTHPEDIERNREYHRQTIAGEKSSYRLEKRYIRKNGTIFWGLIQAAVMYDVDGQPMYMIGQVQDITELKETGEALRQTEERHRQLVEYSPIPITVHSAYSIEYINPAAVSLLGGASQAEFVGKDPISFLSPPDRQLARERVADVYEKRITAPITEFRFTTLDGRTVVVESTSAPVEYDGKPAAQTVFRDITQRKEAESALAKSEELFRGFFEHGAAGMAIMDLEGNIEKVNPAFAGCLGYAPEDLPGKNIKELIHPEDWEKNSREAMLVVTGQKPFTIMEKRYVRKDGDTRCVISSLSAVLDEGGRPISLINQSQDITEKREVEKALLESKSEWAHAMNFFEDATYILDMDLRVKSANTAFYMMTGLSPASVIGRKITEIMHHDEGIDCPVCGAQKNRRDDIITLEADHPANPAGRPMEVMVKMIRDETGKPNAILMGIHDLTRQRSYESALSESEEKYKMLISNLAEGVMVVQDGVIRLANESASSMFGYSKEELSGSNFLDFISPKEQGRMARMYEDRMAGRDAPNRYEVKVVAKDGRELDTSVSIGMINFEGKPAVLSVVWDITESKKALEAVKESKEALKESEERYRALVEGSQDCICLLDLEGRLLFMNRKGIELNGFSSLRDVVGRSSLDLVGEEFKPVLKGFIKKSIKGETCKFSYMTQPMGRPEMWWESVINPVYGGDGKVAGLIRISRDITERKKAEEEIIRSREILEIIGQAQTGYIEDPEAGRTFDNLLTRITELSKSEYGFLAEVGGQGVKESYFKILSVSGSGISGGVKEFIKKNIYNVSIAGSMSGILKDAIGSGKPIITNSIMADMKKKGFPQGHPDIKSFMSLPLMKGQKHIGLIGLGNRMGGYTASVADDLEPVAQICMQLMEAAKAEQRRLEAEKAVRENEALLDRLFSSTQILLALLDTDMNFIKVNKAYAELDGKNEEFYVGKNHFKLYPSNENEEIFRRVVATGESYITYSKPFVYENAPERGVTYWDVSLQPVSEEGKATGLLVSLLNVTKRREAEEKAKLHQKQLIQADKMKSLGILVSGVAHEINNPNSFIAVNAPLLKKIWKHATPLMKKGAAEEEYLNMGGMPFDKALEATPKLLDGISEGSRRIQVIVDKLKDFARVQPTVKKGPVFINQAVESALLLTASLARKSTFNFSKTLAEGIPPFTGNQYEIEQVLVNLISNALQSLEDKSALVEVRTSYDSVNKKVIVSVHDEGSGISEENISKITDPFFTTRRDTGGTGLGLSVSFEIVRDHGGAMKFESLPGKGTVVTVEFDAIQENKNEQR